MPGLVNERSAVDIVDLDFNKAFDTVSRNILIDGGWGWMSRQWRELKTT